MSVGVLQWPDMCLSILETLHLHQRGTWTPLWLAVLCAWVQLQEVLPHLQSGCSAIQLRGCWSLWLLLQNFLSPQFLLYLHAISSNPRQQPFMQELVAIVWALVGI